MCKKQIRTTASQTDSEDVKTLTWSGTIEMMVSLLGYTAGLSDYWRFPYMVWRNGGGAFLFAFLSILIITGLPTVFLELSSSQYCGKGVFQIWNVCPLFKGLGISIMIMNFGFLVYNFTYRFWLLDYFFNSFKSDIPWTSCTNDWNTDFCRSNTFNHSSFVNTGNTTTNISSMPKISIRSPEEEFWQFKVLDLSSGLEDIGRFRWTYIIYSFVYRAVIVIITIKSIKTFGKVMYVTAVTPMVIILAMFIQSLTLNGAVDGILFFITPDFTKLANPKIWIEAMFMVFYTLGPGWGGVMVLGSHAKFTNNCIRTSIIACIADVSIAIFNSLALFSIIGVMAFEIGIPIRNVVQSGMAVGLVGYTRAMSYLPWSNVWAVLFFLALILSTMDSQVVILETLMTFIDEWRMKTSDVKSRLFFLTMLSFAIIVLNLPFCTQAGAYMFQLMDWYQPTWPAIVVVFLETIIFSWIFGGDRFDHCVQNMLGRKIPHYIRIPLAFLCPLMFLVLLFTSFASYKPPTYGSYQYPEYAQGIGWIIAIFMVIPIPLYMGVAIYKEQGGIPQRIRKLKNPSKSWGANDIRFRSTDAKVLEEKRTLFDLMYYNALGRYRHSSTKDSIVPETVKLNDCDIQNNDSNTLGKN